MSTLERDQLRSVFFAAWHKHKENLPLEPIEAQLLEIILVHPEYHEFLDDQEKFQVENFTDHNPFMHLSLHLAVREQIITNRPQGIAKIYQTLEKKFHDTHVVEHKILDCLAQILWDAQQSGKMPDESLYLERLMSLS